MGQREYISLKPLIDDRDSIFKAVLTPRGDGKTTELKTLALQSFFATGKAAVYVRRWDTEFTDDFYDSFTVNVDTAHPELLQGKNCEIKGSRKKLFHLYIDGVKAITFVALSRAHHLKSSFDWVTHRNIYFDEYTPLDGRYLSGEIDRLLELYTTIDRKHYDNYVLFAGNYITGSIQILDVFNVPLPLKQGLNRSKKRRFCVLYYVNQNNKDLDAVSPLAELTEGLSYNGYLLGGTLYRSNAPLVDVPQGDTPVMRLSVSGDIYGIFFVDNYVVVGRISAKKYKSAPLFAVTPTQDKHGTLCLTIAPAVRRQILFWKYSNSLAFDTQVTADKLQEFYNSL